MKHKFLLFFLFSLFASTLQANVYVAPMKASAWMVSASPVQCELYQHIPRYGRVRIMQSSGGKMIFAVEVMIDASTEGTVTLASETPMWKPATYARELFQLSTVKGRTPIVADTVTALTILYELEIGMVPTLTYQDWVDGSSQVRVALSPVNFLDVLPIFHTCLQQLLPYGIDSVKPASLLFDHNLFELTSVTRSILDEMMAFAMAHKSARFIVDGHTDNVGTPKYNMALSRRRTNSVMSYLLSNGISASKIVIHTHGEKRPWETNRTDVGRAANRRVRVSLVRE